MSITSLLLRLFLIFLLIEIILFAYIISPIEFKIPNNTDGLIFVGLVFWLCSKFGEKNKRYFTKKEKYIVILGMFFIGFFIQTIFSGILIALTNISANVFIFATFIAGIMNLITVIGCVYFAKKRLIKLKIIDG